VCLHGHTLHSEECLSFLPRYLHRIPGVSQIVSGYQRGAQPAVDFSRAFWTPPLTPASAFQLEREQIANLDLYPQVSLTDHDNIEAGIALRAAGHTEVPISLEWTVPYRRTILHLGIHNLPPVSAQFWISAMADFTAAPEEDLLREILSGLASIPDVLIVLNHPFWLEEGVEDAGHRPALDNFLREYISKLHAFELNGTRRWVENAATIELAIAFSRPVISGGDRHACEPAACLNLTNAATVSEFAGEVRDGESPVLFMPHYRQPMELRLLEAACDILRLYPEYADRSRWIDRVFYRGDDGTAQSLAMLWKNREPWFLRPATGASQILAATHIRGALRYFFSRPAEALP
jgi:hypothetical protein